ncbi:Flp pilus assembly complex ATPase component TadA (plasmid) [Cupriavidus pinatubonensis]|uniref:ATPase, T2SS/T4P/T4SS family n=1 Tax=Cupriavidus pinatubonensis TaxID=248026 RepID=UPI001C73C659|nr:ATPase, T2SS/T4P/T4SS family [Cupriavidus pinatubonensis]QYY33638.1 Flp pilus assembly complex ATPase component TadA [Cupriavidus pinatubonensis]
MDKARDQAHSRIVEARQRGVLAWSSESGKYPANDAARELLCLTSDGVLHVLAGKQLDPHVLSYQQLVRAQGVGSIRPREVGFSELKLLYNELSGSNRIGDPVRREVQATDRQAEVIGYVKEAVVEKASDIHLVVHDDVGYIEYRPDGDLYEFYQLSGQHVRDLMSSIYHSMCDVADETFKPSRSQDARLSSAFVKQMGLYGARVSTRPTDRGMMMVIRLLYRSRNAANSVAALRFFPEQIEDLQTMRRSRYGINIVSGATGSGKSLTLSVIMGETVEEGRQRMATTGQPGSRGRPKGIRVITIEDPPEYSPEGVLATPLNAEGPNEEQISRAWSTGISDLLRKDPDVLMIGETRDQASAAAAYRAALTGHVAWTTLHTSDATSVPQRLIDLGLDRTLILDPMLSTGFVNQSLTKLVCTHCALEYAEHKHELPEDLNERIERFCDPTRIRLRGPGCPKCRYGTIDRVLIAETVVPTGRFMEIYRDAGKIAARKYWVIEMGGLTKCQALIRRINAGEVDPRDGEADVSPLDTDLRMLGIAGTPLGTSGRLRAA